MGYHDAAGGTGQPCHGVYAYAVADLAHERDDGFCHSLATGVDGDGGIVARSARSAAWASHLRGWSPFYAFVGNVLTVAVVAVSPLDGLLQIRVLASGAAGPLVVGAHLALAVLLRRRGASWHQSLHVGCKLRVVEVFGVHHQDGYHVALFGRQGQSGVLDHRHEGKPVGGGGIVVYILGGYESAVAQHHIHERGGAGLDVLQDEHVGRGDVYHGHRHVGLKGHLGHLLVRVFHLGLLDIPVDGDGLIADGGEMGGHVAGAYQHVLAVGVVLLGGHIEMIISLVEMLEEHVAVVARHIAHHQRAGVVVGESDGGSAHIGPLSVLVAVDGVFVLYTHLEAALVFAYHLDIEEDLLAVSLLAVDGYAALLDDVDIEVGGIEPQHHRGTVAGGHRRHGGRRGEADELGEALGQIHGYLARGCQSCIGDDERIEARLVLGHRGVDAVGLDHQRGRVLLGVVVGGHIEACALIGGDGEDQLVPVLGLGQRRGEQGIGNLGCTVARQYSHRAEADGVGSGIGTGHADIVQVEVGHVLQHDFAHKGLAHEELVGDIVGGGTAEAIDLEVALLGGEVLTRGAYAEAELSAHTRGYGIVDGEVAGGVAHGCQSGARTCVDDVGLYLYAGSGCAVGALDTTGEHHLVAEEILVLGCGDGEGIGSHHLDVYRAAVVHRLQLGHFAVGVDVGCHAVGSGHSGCLDLCPRVIGLSRGDGLVGLQGRGGVGQSHGDGCGLRHGYGAHVLDVEHHLDL